MTRPPSNSSTFVRCTPVRRAPRLPLGANRCLAVLLFNVRKRDQWSLIFCLSPIQSTNKRALYPTNILECSTSATSAEETDTPTFQQLGAWCACGARAHSSAHLQIFCFACLADPSPPVAASLSPSDKGIDDEEEAADQLPVEAAAAHDMSTETSDSGPAIAAISCRWKIRTRR